MKTNYIDIVLPSRIGDSILSIPAAVCLEQLICKYGSNQKVRVLARPFLVELFNSLGLFTCKGMNWEGKAYSHVFVPDKAFYVETTSHNFGYRSKTSYGIVNPCKKLLKFDKEPVYLSFSARPLPQTWEKIKQSFPEQLILFLVDEKRLPWYSACLFGICLDCGYSAEQIIETFDFSPELINLEKFPALRKDKYVVFCIEAGYGRKHLHERCWDIDKYFEIAEKCAQDFGVKTVFIGKGATPLPQADYVEDLRGKLSIYELACVMRGALMYIGNDTGPMHVANLMKRPSVSMYFKNEHMTGFHPVFPQFNKQMFNPQGIDSVYEEVSRVLNDALILPVIR